MEPTSSRRRRPGRMAELGPGIPAPRRAFIDEMRRGRDGTGRSLQALATEMYSSKASVSRWLNGQALPTRKQAQQWAELCGTDPDRMGDLWDRANDPVEPPKEPDPVKEPHPGQGNRRTLLAAAVVGLAIVLVVVGFFTLRRPASPSVAADPCTLRATGPAVVQPVPRQIEGFTFCPVEINGGKLPITGPFRLAGQIVGPLSERERMVLVVSSDPSTCDALGNPAPDGEMLIRDAALGSPDGSWAYVDHLGYDEAVTYIRNFEYILATPEALTAIKNDRDHYVATGGNSDNYAGITTMPDGAVVVSRFSVPAGLYHGSPGFCRR